MSVCLRLRLLHASGLWFRSHQCAKSGISSSERTAADVTTTAAALGLECVRGDLTACAGALLIDMCRRLVRLVKLVRALAPAPPAARLRERLRESWGNGTSSVCHCSWRVQASAVVGSFQGPPGGFQGDGTTRDWRLLKCPTCFYPAGCANWPEYPANYSTPPEQPK